jgi:hypothetical protein
VIYYEKRHWSDVAAYVLSAVMLVLSCAMIVRCATEELSPTPAPSASASSSSTTPGLPVDTRTDAYAKFRAESDKWHDERGRFARLCYESNGVPVFTFEMRLFCISRDVGETRIVGGGARGQPDRDAPEFPVGSP